MVKVRAILCPHCIEHFLSDCCPWKAQSQLFRSLEGQIEILLMEGNPKAGIKGAFDHSLAVHVKDTALGKTSQQGLPNFDRVGTRL